MAIKPIANVGKCFTTVDAFLAYLRTIKFKSWRPAYVTMHHTGNPDIDIWENWQTRQKPVSDEQWMRNLAVYYATPVPGVKGAWSTGPHFFITPKGYCVLSLPDRPGTHATSFNANSWGVECVGNFDAKQDKLTPELLEHYAAGIAALHLAVGLQPDPYVFKRSGLHFHRDDPKTKKSCPGSTVGKAAVVKAVTGQMQKLLGAPSVTDTQDKVTQVKDRKPELGVVVNVPKNDTLNIRASAGAKSPVIDTLKPGEKVSITGSAMNVKTKWYSIDIDGDADGWVSSAYIKIGQ